MAEAEERLGEDAAEAGEAVRLGGRVDAADAIVEPLVAGVLAGRVVVAEQAQAVGIGPGDVDLFVEREVVGRRGAELQVGAGVVARADREHARAQQRIGGAQPELAQRGDVRVEEAHVHHLLHRFDLQRDRNGRAFDARGALLDDRLDGAAQRARFVAQIDQLAERVGLVEHVAHRRSGDELRHQLEVDRARGAAARRGERAGEREQRGFVGRAAREAAAVDHHVLPEAGGGGRRREDRRSLDVEVQPARVDELLTLPPACTFESWSEPVNVPGPMPEIAVTYGKVRRVRSKAAAGCAGTSEHARWARTRSCRSG